MSPIFPIELGGVLADGASCPVRKVPGFDDTGGCGARTDVVDSHRTAHPCREDCVQMGFKSCATKTPVDDCLCQDGTTTAPGDIITGGLIGWNDPVGQSLTDIAKLTGPVAGILGDPGAYYRLFAANDATDLNCPVDEDDWDALLIAGDTYAKDLAANPIDSSTCTGGVITLTLADLNIEDGDGPAGGHCLQKGGRRAFAIGVYDCNGKRIMFCPFPGIMPPPQCDKVPCCNWAIVNTSTSEDGTSATIGISIARPDNCTCTPVSVTVTIDGTPYVVDPSLTSYLVEHVVTPYTVGQTVLVELDQSYAACDEPECITKHDEEILTL